MITCISSLYGRWRFAELARYGSGPAPPPATEVSPGAGLPTHTRGHWCSYLFLLVWGWFTFLFFLGGRAWFTWVSVLRGCLNGVPWRLTLVGFTGLHLSFGRLNGLPKEVEWGAVSAI